MRAGRLRHQVILQQPQPCQTTLGEKQVAWIEVATVWAGVETLSGSEPYAADQHYHRQQTRIIIRYRADIQAGWRVMHDGKCFAIQHINDNAGLRRELHLSGEWLQELSHAL